MEAINAFFGGISDEALRADIDALYAREHQKRGGAPADNPDDEVHYDTGSDDEVVPDDDDANLASALL